MQQGNRLRDETININYENVKTIMNKIIAFIFARGGSKGCWKNILNFVANHLLHGQENTQNVKELIEYSFNRFVKIAKIASKYSEVLYSTV